MKSKIAVVGVFIIFLVVITLFIYKQLTIKNISVIGNKNLTEEEIKNLINIKEGSSAILPFPKTIYERLKQSAWIKEATIRKDLNGVLTIYIIEANPLAILQIENKAYLIDDQGVILEELREISNEGVFLPVIKDIDPFKNKETLTEAINLLVFLNKNKIINSDQKIKVEGKFPEDITLYIDSFSIIVGKGDFERKFTKFRVVNEEIQKRQLKVKYIDLRFPDRVIFKPQEETK
ncbi:MAG: FtsQ-type POTRA domain-containing protein [Thermodesulfovibrio sp.]|nr:FtsQ-type POTRA domain-containing protein [Thermodesulfovibrio sp.]